MSYCTQSDLLTLIDQTSLIQLTDDINSGSINTINVVSAIEYAESIINGYLRAKYSLPLSFVPDLLKSFAMDIAAFRLYSRRLLDMPESLRDSYKNTIKMLENVQSGKLSIGLIGESGDEKVQEPTKYLINKDSKTFPKSLLDSY